MPTIKVVDMSGKEVSTLTLSDKVFGAEVNSAVLHTAVKAYLANQRQGTQSTLTRTEVSGGGKKPWKQKGTGRARQGSTRSPQWTHGGVALGPKPRSYRITINEEDQENSTVQRTVLQGRRRQDDRCEQHRNRRFQDENDGWHAGRHRRRRRRSSFSPRSTQRSSRACDNIEGVNTTVYNSVNVYDILNCDTLVVAEAAVKKIEEVYA